MTTAEQRHHEAVHRIAEEYRGSGYEVQVEPSEGPEFLQPYTPDLVITKGDERYIVEVAIPSQRSEGFWASLAEKIAAQPGWRFRIIVAGVGEEEEDPGIRAMATREEIEAQIETPRLLFRQGQSTAALMLACSLFEATARLRMLDDDRDPARASPPVALAKSLLRLGYVEQAEFELLRETMHLRDRVAHGYFGTPVPLDRVMFLMGVVRRLLRPSDAEGEAPPG